MQSSESIILDTKLVDEIEGKFYVASYQRGYRWGETEVQRLLQDIVENGNNNYCLQPIVVKRKDDYFELIDGQQRLTTIYLIYKYLHSLAPNFMKPPRFSIEYETRKDSANYLSNLDEKIADTNIDYWHINEAYKTIDEWISSKEDTSTAATIATSFEKFVKVIWYEVDEQEDSIALFTRLNIGKIPLTSAELVKAMFLSKSTTDGSIKDVKEIAFQWDFIEKHLHDAALWFFLTNKESNNEYQTRIDLILDLISNKKSYERDKYYTFFYFDGLRREGDDLSDIWDIIYNAYLTLVDWFENHTLYHKIGYLITSKYSTLNHIFKESKDLSKSAFECKLDKMISQSVSTDSQIHDLSYEKFSEKNLIYKILLLFNIESVRLIDGQSQRFAFDKFKSRDCNGVWSLEHIHARNADVLKTQEAWVEWLKYHLCSLEELNKDKSYNDLINDINELLDKDIIDRNSFSELSDRIITAMSNDEYDQTEDNSIKNLALINSGNNSSLSNSTFDVKRNKILEMDKDGKYLPFCTRMVFLKYYTRSRDTQLHFWGDADKDAYCKRIIEVLKSYLMTIDLERD